MPARIFSLTAADTQSLKELKSLFEQQAVCLRKRNIDGLPELNEKILSLTTSLQGNAGLRSSCLKELGFEDNRSGMQQLLAVHGTPSVIEEWETFSQLAKECQTANKVAGRLLTMQQDLTDILLGKLGRSQETGYDQSGSENYYGSQISLGYA
ncbi:flagellar protein FlgN [Parendozoicomonas haliclonae]|uniref:FlgN protein n=1 Tax=Parendozoicomonas haliclonae TaxID=1960125 RepID=A0A1X7AQG5_9GAMM|nr:flagellar protein FlgN [Parendozoicomonas haliclonae]SMA49647.1 FlgN protein [Parendozoicomonas haliclonae]